MNKLKVVILKELSNSIDYLNEIIGIVDSDSRLLEMCGEFIMHYYHNVHDIEHTNDVVLVKFKRFNKLYIARFKIEDFVLNEIKLL